MQKIFFLIVVLSFLVAAPGVSAQDSELPSPGITPDSPFYFLDTLAEKIGMFFTFDIVRKAEKAFQYAGEKLAEVKVMAEVNKVGALKKAGQKYQEYLALFFEKGGEASEEGKDVKELEETAKRRSLDYLILLSDTYEQAPEEAKAEIENLRNASRKSFGETIWSLHEEKIKELREEKIREELKKAIKMPEKEGIKARKDVIAIVNGVEIAEDEFIQRLRLYILSNESQMRQAGQWQRADETEDEFIQRLMPLLMPSLGKAALEYMITEIIFEQKAKEQNITVKPEEIDKKIAELKPKPTAENLSKMGITMEDLRRQIELQIVIEEIIAKSVFVTEKEIRDYFESHKAIFTKPEEIRASHILLRTEEEAKIILSQLKAGADFAELARKESTDSITKDKGGDLGFFSRGKMTPAFEEAAFALKVGEISEVIKTPYGYHIIKVEERKPAQEANLELAREEIKKTLTEQKTMTIRSNLPQNLRKEAQIEIILPELRD